MYSLYSFLSFSFILFYKYEHEKGINNKKLKTENVSIEDVYEALSDNKAQNGRYSLTLLGKMIYDTHIATCRILSYHWKLKAIESIQASAPGCARLPVEEFSKVVDTLIDDPKIKNFITKTIVLPPPLTNSEKRPRQQQEEVQTINVLARMV